MLDKTAATQPFRIDIPDRPGSYLALPISLRLRLAADLLDGEETRIMSMTYGLDQQLMYNAAQSILRLIVDSRTKDLKGKHLAATVFALERKDAKIAKLSRPRTEPRQAEAQAL